MRLLLLACVLLFSQFIYAQNYTQTYSAGAIGGPNNYTTPTPTSCPGIMTFTNIPAGAVIDSVQVTYQMFTSLAGFGNASLQRSYLRCPTTQVHESQLTAPTGTGVGTTNTYIRTVSIANGILNGNLVLELHAGNADALSFSSCTGSANVVVNNSWTVTVYTSQGSCLQPTLPTITYDTGDTVRLGWTSPGLANRWQIEYGDTNAAANLTRTIVSQTQATISGLQQLSWYKARVRGICGAGDTSRWTPFLVFQTDTFSCAAPDSGWGGALAGGIFLGWRAQLHAQRYDISYGPPGFTLGSGINFANIINDTFVITPPPLGGALDFYVRQFCGLSYSPWSGPFRVSWSTTSVEEVGKGVLNLYPNPVRDELWIESAVAVQWEIFSIAGQLIQAGVASSGTSSVDVQKLPAGLYLLRTEKGYFRFVKN